MKDGGRAYPYLTMRQAYKMAALADFIGGQEDVQNMAKWCGEIADAMIAEDEEAAKR